MSPSHCPMTPLVHADRDGRLGDRELAALQRHLKACPQCAELMRDLERLSEMAQRLAEPLPERNPLEHRRARLELLRDAASPPPAARPPAAGRRWATWAAAAAVLGVLVWVGSVAASAADEPLELGRWGLAPPVAAGPAGQAPAARVTAQGAARFERVRSAGVEQVTLSTGTIDVVVPRLLAGERFLVATSDAEIEVRGTEFQVSAADGRLEAVVVREGSVEVRIGGETTQLGAGDAWRSARALAALDRVDQSPSGPVAATPELGSDGRHGDSEPTAPAGRQARLPSTVRAAAGDSTTPPAAPSERPSAASAAFSGAVRSLEQGHYARAVRQLQAFVARYPDDPRVEDADYLRIVAQQRAGQPEAAAAAAQNYLERHPEGYRRDEAKTLAGAEDPGHAPDR